MMTNHPALAGSVYHPIELKFNRKGYSELLLYSMHLQAYGELLKMKGI